MHAPWLFRRPLPPWAALASWIGWLSGCTTPLAPPPDPAHLQQAAALPTAKAPIPPITRSELLPPPPLPGQEEETYNVVVHQVELPDLLFALARDARINVDIHPGIHGPISLNAVNQTLPQILERLARQADIRYRLRDGLLEVMPDTPFLHTYKVDYVNMERDTAGTVAVTTQIATAGPGANPAAGTVTPTNTAQGSGNSSITRVENKAHHKFWESLIQNLKDLLRETDKILPEGSSETVVEQASAQTTTGTGSTAPAARGKGSAVQNGLAASPNPATLQNSGTTIVRKTTFREAASVIAHPETGTLTVRATQKQQEKVQEYLDAVMASAKRQVLIEATIAEVQLSQNYQQGIDWLRLNPGSGWSVVQEASANLTDLNANFFQLSYTRTGDGRSNQGTLKLLESFGVVKVLSSPKISVMNNQTAVIKVIDNEVYFTIKADTTQNQTTTVTTYTTTLNSVPVGFVMNVTPEISHHDSVLLNIRPSISRIVSYVADPNPALRANAANGLQSDITSQIPVIRTREMETMIRVENGNIAVMGGLMEEGLRNADNTVPGLSRIPLLGNLFTHRNDATSKTELVIFLRPTVIREASLDGDYRAQGRLLPDPEFFRHNPGPRQQIAPSGWEGAP